MTTSKHEALLNNGSPFTIWVDADACPKMIKEILFRAALRTKTMVTLVANQFLHLPPSPYLKTLRAAAGFDMADNLIIQHVQPGELVVTADIPLANEVVNKKAIALNPRGELYTQDNIKRRLTMRNLNEELRSSGLNIGGPPPLSKKELHAFAQQLDHYLHSITGTS